MSSGRPPTGPRLVDNLDGSDQEKIRLRLILETVTGDTSVKDAAEELGISPSRFHALRKEALQGALAALEPGVVGRPRSEEEPPDPDELARLREEKAEAQYQQEVAMVRAEIALTMPHLIQESPETPEKGGTESPRSRRRKARKGARKARRRGH